MRKFIGVLFSVVGFAVNAILLCGLMIIGLDLINRAAEDKKAPSGKADK